MSQSLLEIRDLCKVFDRGKNSEVVAAHHINLTIKAGECISVVGESGCGKSTLAKLVTMILKADSGQIIFEGEDLVKLGPRKLRLKRQKMQMVFQQPMSAISPRMTIGEFMKIPLRNFNIVPKHMMEEEVDHLLAMVSLPAYYKNKLPHEVSGGELQRVMIARAMAGHPALLIFDEATSALDVAVQQEIVELINRLQKETGVACIFITHDLSLVHQVSQRVVVMYRGRIVEEMGSHNIVSKCLHPYSKLLISSVFTVQCDQNRIPDVLPEDIKVEKHPDSCPFYGRCPKGCAACGEIKNILMPIPRDEGHQIACHLVMKDIKQQPV